VNQALCFYPWTVGGWRQWANGDGAAAWAKGPGKPIPFPLSHQQLIELLLGSLTPSSMAD
jgi:hypothetical protein